MVRSNCSRPGAAGNTALSGRRLEAPPGRAGADLSFEQHGPRWRRHLERHDVGASGRLGSRGRWRGRRRPRKDNPSLPVRLDGLTEPGIDERAAPQRPCRQQRRKLQAGRPKFALQRRPIPGSRADLRVASLRCDLQGVETAVGRARRRERQDIGTNPDRSRRVATPAPDPVLRSAPRHRSVAPRFAVPTTTGR